MIPLLKWPGSTYSLFEVSQGEVGNTKEKSLKIKIG